MNILIIGNELNDLECQQKFGPAHVYRVAENHKAAEKLIPEQDVIFDFIIDKHPDQMEIYKDGVMAAVFLNTVNGSLTQLTGLVGQMESNPFGFAGLPSFLNRLILEVSVVKESDKTKLAEICKKLKTEFVIVDDRMGLVTPRVICMLINEAYFTVEEGTATREDIDLAMKLGTNYPFGPFEWAQKIGIENVYGLLTALHEDTKDERYLVCPLLRSESLHRN